MDAIDILGDLLGQKKRQSGKGSDILKDIFGRGSSRKEVAKPKRPDEIKREANDLEDLLNVANGRADQRTGRTNRTAPAPHADSRRDDAHPRSSKDDNERAIVLVRAMVNAAKADGQLDRKEQQNIIERMGNSSAETLNFLKREFDRPLDVDEFVREVPVGMEQQVYTLSLIVIDLDTGREATYLVNLANGLRLPMEVREKIHADLGAPSVY